MDMCKPPFIPQLLVQKDGEGLMPLTVSGNVGAARSVTWWGRPSAVDCTSLRPLSELVPPAICLTWES